MVTSVNEILAPLAPHWDRIIRRPLDSVEVNELGQQVGLAVPAPLREYLMEVGLFQDLTMWEASQIEVYESVPEFVSARQCLNEILPPKRAANLFPFGGDGAGNEFCLPSGEGPWRIHFVDHETGKVSKRKEFTDWLQAVVKKVLRGIRRRPPNERKVWAVQFSLPGVSFEELLTLLSSAGTANGIDPEWMNSQTTEAGVTTTRRQFELNGERLTASRLEYAAWPAPRLYFDFRERLDSALEQSQIRKLDLLFKEKCAGYRLVDYGPLDAGRTV